VYRPVGLLNLGLAELLIDEGLLITKTEEGLVPAVNPDHGLVPGRQITIKNIEEISTIM
jgi:hypothetical protein